jgi:putative ABC transport system permease protein
MGVANVSAGRPLPVVVTPARLGSLLALTLGMCAGSAISAMVVVTRVDPVTVFAR